MTGESVILHASAVAVGDRACLITGEAGAGKSTLAIAMIALGAELVADDRVNARHEGGALILSAPSTLAGLIEARGAGILRLPSRARARLGFIIDLDRAETERLPDPSSRAVLGVPVRVLSGRGRAGLAALAVVLLRHGLPLDPDAPVGAGAASD